MTPNEKVGVSEQIEFALEKHIQSIVLDQKLVKRGSIDQYKVIFYMAVWSEVAREVDFFEKSCLGELWEGVKK